MSNPTIVIIAAASAVAGATAATIGFYSIRPKRTVNIESKPSSRTSPAIPVPGNRPAILRSPAPPVDPAGIFQYGFPGPINDLADRQSLISSFDRRLRNPSWVAEHITPESLLMNNADRKHSYFVEDRDIPEKFRAKLKDYARSGYDRGHQVPAADAQWSQAAMNDTFNLTNMCPQVGNGFNRDYWAHVEDFCRRLTSTFPSVRVVTGPLYLPRKGEDGKWRVSYEVIGSPPNIAVPTHFYKVIFAEDGRTGGNVSLGAFVLPNAEISNERPLTDFEVPLEAVERASGLEFAKKLPTSRRSRLCSQVDCGILVREYEDRHQSLIGPGVRKKQ